MTVMVTALITYWQVLGVGLQWHIYICACTELRNLRAHYEKALQLKLG